jgi:hypothetical protein
VLPHRTEPLPRSALPLTYGSTDLPAPKRAEIATRVARNARGALDATGAAVRLVIANALVENGEGGGRGFDTLFAMRQAEAVVRALELAGYEIKRRI